MQDNKPMLNNLAKQIQHHAKELTSVINSTDEIEAWVLAKAERSATDLSDITHYLEGVNNVVGKKILYKFNEGENMSRKAIILKDNGDSYLVRIIDNGDMHNRETNVKKDDIIQIFERHEYVNGGMMAKGGLIATSPSLEGIKKIIGNYYYSPNILLKRVEGSNEYEVHNAKGKISSVKVVEKKGRFQFLESDNFGNGGYVKVVLDEGYGRVINQLYNEWNNVKNQKEYDNWVSKVQNTNFGTYGTVPIWGILENFDFDNAPINNFHLKSFKNELKSALNKMSDSGMMDKGGKTSLGSMFYSDKVKNKHQLLEYLIDFGIDFRNNEYNYFWDKELTKIAKESGYTKHKNLANSLGYMMFFDLQKEFLKKYGGNTYSKGAKPFLSDGGYMAKGGMIEEGDYVFVKPEKLNAEVVRVTGENVVVEFTDRRPVGGDKRGNYKIKDLKKISDSGYMAKGGKVDMLKEGDYVWNAVGKKLVVDDVTDTEYSLSGFMQKGASAWSKTKVDSYIKNGEWSLKPKMSEGGYMDKETAINNYKKFQLNSEGNFEAEIDGKKYEIIYRDDKTKIYDLFENGKKIKSSKSIYSLATLNNSENSIKKDRSGIINRHGVNINDIYKIYEFQDDDDNTLFEVIDKRTWERVATHVNREDAEMWVELNKWYDYEEGGEIKRFDRHKEMDAETGEKILSLLKELSYEDYNTSRLENYLYGLFDGYDYSKTDNFKKEMNKLNLSNKALYNEINATYQKINQYSSDGHMAKGGVTFLGEYKDDERPQYFRRFENAIGSFAWEYNKKYNEGILYPLSDFDKSYYSHLKLKSGEHLFRYKTDRMVQGSAYLIKINLDKSLIYFMTDSENDDDKNPIFDTRGIKAEYITVQRDTYSDGGYMAKGGETDGVDWDKDSDGYRTEMGAFKLNISPCTQKGYWNVYVSEGNKSVGKAYDVYGIDNAKDKAYDIVSNQYKMAKGGSISKFNPMELIGRTFFGKTNHGKIKNVRVLSDDNIRVEYVTKGYGLFIEKSFTKKQLFDMSKGKEINGDSISTWLNVVNESEMSDGGYMANGVEIMKHKHYDYITIELIEPTNKGWKVKQIETHTSYGKKLSKPKEKIAYYSKDEIKDLFKPYMEDGGYMAKGGEIKKDDYFVYSNGRGVKRFRILKINGDKVTTEYSTNRSIVQNIESKEDLIESLKEGYIKKVTEKEYWNKKYEMAKGGMTFADKVDSVKARLLKGKKVSPSVQKDYGKTYNPKEAEDSAKRIVGSQVAKYKMK